MAAFGASANIRRWVPLLAKQAYSRPHRRPVAPTRFSLKELRILIASGIVDHLGIATQGILHYSTICLPSSNAMQNRGITQRRRIQQPIYQMPVIQQCSCMHMVPTHYFFLVM